MFSLYFQGLQALTKLYLRIDNIIVRTVNIFFIINTDSCVTAIVIAHSACLAEETYRSVSIKCHNIICLSFGGFHLISEGNALTLGITHKARLDSFVFQKDIHLLFQIDELSNCTHKKYAPFISFLKKSVKKQSHRSDRIAKYLYNPIGQALAPYLLAGCCAVNELVSHALFIGYF